MMALTMALCTKSRTVGLHDDHGHGAGEAKDAQRILRRAGALDILKLGPCES
jgi:hypothetical protein